MFKNLIDRIKLKRKFSFFIDSVKTYYTFFALKRSLCFVYSDSVWYNSFYDYYKQILPPGYELYKDEYLGEYFGILDAQEGYMWILDKKTGRRIDIIQLVYNRHSDWWNNHSEVR